MPRVESKRLRTAEERQLDVLRQSLRAISFSRCSPPSGTHWWLHERAELHELSAAPPQPVHAGVAQNFPAVRALSVASALGCRGQIKEPSANTTGGAGRDTSKLGMAMVTSVVSTSTRHLPVQALTSRQPGFFDALAADERAVGRSAVAHHDPVVRDHDFAMHGGHRGCSI